MAITQLPQTPNVGPEVDNALWKWLIEIGNRIRALIDQANTPFSLPAHKATHATGGSDAMTPADIGAAAATQEAWQTPTFQNSWANYGGGFSTAAYYKDSLGIVHLKGLVKNGTASTIFVLPAGYRPLEAKVFASVANNVWGRVDVGGGGNVAWNTGGTNAFVSLDCISFRAEA